MKKFVFTLLVMLSLSAYAEEVVEETHHYVLTADGRVLVCVKEDGELVCGGDNDFKPDPYSYDMTIRSDEK